MELPYSPIVLAYSGIGNPLRILKAENLEVFQEINGNLVSQTDQLDINVNQNGIIQSFFIHLNLLFSSVSPVPAEPDPINNIGLINVQIYRDGTLLYTNLLDTVRLYQDGIKKGVILYETLNFLAGSEVYSGENFQIKLGVPQGESGNFKSWVAVFEVSMTMAIKSTPKQFIL